MHILRNLLTKDLDAQSDSIFFLREVALAMSCNVAAWICIFLTSRILPNFCKKSYFVCSSDNPMYTTLCTTTFHGFCRIFKWRGELVCGAQISWLKSLQNLERCWPYQGMRREEDQKTLQVVWY